MRRLRAIASAFLLFTGHHAVANMGPGGFSPFPNYYFVETGSFRGDSIAKALQTRLFTEIYSMDIDPICVQNCSRRFKSHRNVHITQGDTARDLGKFIQKIDQPATFWLDAHNGAPDPYGARNTPLLDELEQIKHHPIKTHTLLIDDMHCCETILFDFMTREQIAQKVLEINPNYKISYVNGGDDGEYPNNVMVARVDAEDVNVYLQGRLPPKNGRYPTFAAALKLLSERNVRTLVETGTARGGDTNFDGDGGSTILFGHWAHNHNAAMFSVDINQTHLDLAQAASSAYSKNMSFILEDSISYLRNFPGQIDFLYLDSYDYDENNPGPSQAHNLNEVIAAYDKLTNHSIIMIDDCNISKGGKGKLAIEYLLKRGWYLHTNRHQVILLKR